MLLLLLLLLLILSLLLLKFIIIITIIIKISEPLKDMTVQQSESFSKPQPQSIKTHLRGQKRQETESTVQEIRESLSPPKQRMMDLLGEKGSSS